MLRRILIVAIWVACISLPDAVAFLAPPTPNNLAIVQTQPAVTPDASALETLQARLDEYLTAWF